MICRAARPGLLGIRKVIGDMPALCAAASARLAYLESRYMLGLRDALVTTRHFTPFDFRDTLNEHVGSAFR